GSAGGSAGAPAGFGGVLGASVKALAAQGPEGVAAANLAQATAPALPGNGGAARGVAPKSGPNASSGSSGVSPADAVFKALTGSSSSGGLGVILPVVLIGGLVGAALLSLRRRRAT